MQPAIERVIFTGELNGLLGGAYRFFFRLITAVVPLSRFYFCFTLIIFCHVIFCTVKYLHTFHFHVRINCYSTIAPSLFTPAIVRIVPVFYTPSFCSTNSIDMNLHAHILAIIFTSYVDEGAWLRKRFV